MTDFPHMLAMLSDNKDEVGVVAPLPSCTVEGLR